MRNNLPDKMMRTLIVIIAIAFFCNSCQTVGSQKTLRTEDAPQLEPQVIQVVDVASFEKGIAQTGAQVIDVRTDREWDAGHIKGANHFEINNPSWQAQIETLDKDAPVYVYCAKGGRSARCAKQLEKAGFTQIYDLDGGIKDWKKEGKPIE